MNTTAEHIGVLAGNPRVEIVDRQIVIDPQLKAFEIAMQFIAENREKIAGIYMVFDHIGIFRSQFIDTAQDLSSKTKKSPKLSHLMPEIRSRYEALAATYAVELNEICIITEEQCRMTMLQLAEREENLQHRNEMFSRGVSACREGICEGTIDKHSDKLRVTCKGITAEVYRRCAKKAEKVVTFWELDPVRCLLHVLKDSIKMATDDLGVDAKIEASFIAGGRITMSTDGSEIDFYV